MDEYEWSLYLGSIIQAPMYRSREEALTAEVKDPDVRVVIASFTTGDVRAALAGWLDFGGRSERQGALSGAASCWAMSSRCHAAIGGITEAQAQYARALEMIRRCSGPSIQALQVVAAHVELQTVLGEAGGLDELSELDS